MKLPLSYHFLIANCGVVILQVPSDKWRTDLRYLLYDLRLEITEKSFGRGWEKSISLFPMALPRQLWFRLITENSLNSLLVLEMIFKCHCQGYKAQFLKMGQLHFTPKKRKDEKILSRSFFSFLVDSFTYIFIAKNLAKRNQKFFLFDFISRSQQRQLNAAIPHMSLSYVGNVFLIFFHSLFRFCFFSGMHKNYWSMRLKKRVDGAVKAGGWKKI